MKTGLVLEGGGLRGAYTAGVLSWFLDHNVKVDYAAGISSGAEHMCSYLQENKEMLKEVSVKWAGSATKIGLEPLIKEGSLVGYDYLFDYILKEIIPLDLVKLKKAKIHAEFGVYDLSICKTVWVSVKDMDDDFKLLRAACTLPLAGKPVEYQGKKYIDGGVTTMIPIERSIEYGCNRHFVVTTKDASFVRKPTGAVTNTLIKFIYRKYPALIKDLYARTEVYYKERKVVDQLVEEGNCLYLYPSVDLGVGRFSGKLKELEALYELGYQDCENRKEEIIRFAKGK